MVFCKNLRFVRVRRLGCWCPVGMSCDVRSFGGSGDDRGCRRSDHLSRIVGVWQKGGTVPYPSPTSILPYMCGVLSLLFSSNHSLMASQSASKESSSRASHLSKSMLSGMSFTFLKTMLIMVRSIMFLRFPISFCSALKKASPGPAMSSQTLICVASHMMLNLSLRGTLL